MLTYKSKRNRWFLYKGKLFTYKNEILHLIGSCNSDHLHYTENPEFNHLISKCDELLTEDYNIQHKKKVSKILRKKGIAEKYTALLSDADREALYKLQSDEIVNILSERFNVPAFIIKMGCIVKDYLVFNNVTSIYKHHNYYLRVIKGFNDMTVEVYYDNIEPIKKYKFNTYINKEKMIKHIENDILIYMRKLKIEQIFT